MKVDGRVFASTFSGETCTFGQDSVPDGWRSQFTQQLTGQNAVYFVPSFFIDPATFNQYDGVLDGDFNVSLTIYNMNTSLIGDFDVVEWWMADDLDDSICFWHRRFSCFPYRECCAGIELIHRRIHYRCPTLDRFAICVELTLLHGSRQSMVLHALRTRHVQQERKWKRMLSMAQFLMIHPSVDLLLRFPPLPYTLGHSDQQP